MAYKPKPFQRPRIELGEHKREWGNWRVSDLVRGDVIPDVGEISYIEYLTTQQQDPSATVFELKVKNVVGAEHILKFDIAMYSEDPIPTIWAFH